MTLASVATIGISLSILFTFVAIVSSLSHTAEQLGRDVGISLYLARTLDASTGEVLASEMAKLPEVETARFVSPTEGMREFEASLGSDARLLEGLPPNLLPPTIEIALAPRVWTTESVSNIARSLAAFSGVEDVRYARDEIERIHRILRHAAVAATVLGAALALATLLVVSNTIRLAVHARRDEIEIMNLVGATKMFIRAPFLVEGAVQGILGSVLATTLLLALGGVLAAGLERGFTDIHGAIEISLEPRAFAPQLFVAGTSLGFIGSLLAVGKFLDR